MRLIVYGDFNCPRSYLASRRVDALVARGLAEVEWRAVEHGPRLSMTGTPTDASQRREFATAAALVQPGEEFPASVPPVVSNTQAAVSAYAEAVTDGIQDELRRALFDVIWVRQQHLSNAYDVRTVITGITRPPQPVRPWLGVELPRPGFGDPRPLHMTRVLGGSIGFTGAPLTTTGWRRVQRWRQEWLALGAPELPAVVDPAGVVLAGARGLAYLTGLATGRPAVPAAGDLLLVG